MQYTSELLMNKSQLVEKVHLYKRGDECIPITGGWEVVGSNIIKDTNYIHLTSSATGTRRISTVNNIELRTTDRILVRMMTPSTSNNHSISFFKGYEPTNTTRFLNSITFSRVALAPITNIPPSTEVIITFYDTTDVDDVFSFVNSFSQWYIYEVWIEKYN